ncbi:MAG: putative ABC transport system ATP-binding protein [bacterium]|nr:MAG: putative ABC transport system ATP-binding protein [bacterium]KAF0148361.1 MAG: putative ABC transport system ATP-binding protein [bacterium]KAF0167822.1 MAG: putative ABC transport system ATP-binding protein [bacterium]TXT18970.1 MAG: putative ABC transport system ATP-binding protein [bacterium]
MSSAPLIEIRDLRYAHGEREVLRGLNLTVPTGRVVGLLGSSGCGKTTLLRLIGGQAVPAGGHVKVAGEVVHELGDDALYRLRRRMGMMFQAGGLFTDLTVFDNVAYPLREHTDLPEAMIRDLVLMKLHAVGLRGARDLMVDELSGGMSRRVALARATALDPMLIMYDEPFAGLDPISLDVIANIIRRLNDNLGLTSIVVTYDVAEALKIIDYAFFIDNGVVVAEGPVEEIRRSGHPFVHQFVHGEEDGPVRFHYPARELAKDFGLAGTR